MLTNVDRIHLKQLTKFRDTSNTYRQWMLQETFGRDTAAIIIDVQTGQEMCMSQQSNYEKAIDMFNNDMTKLSSINCVHCGRTNSHAFKGQLYWQCRKCLFMVFQDSNLGKMKRIANLIDFNEKCVKHIHKNQHKDAECRFYEMWLCRLEYTQSKIDFYTKNKHSDIRKKQGADPFGLKKIIADYYSRSLESGDE